MLIFIFLNYLYVYWENKVGVGAIDNSHKTSALFRINSGKNLLSFDKITWIIKEVL